jgi:hypothetical protein
MKRQQQLGQVEEEELQAARAAEQVAPAEAADP